MTKEQFEALPVGAMYVIVAPKSGHRHITTKAQGDKPMFMSGGWVLFRSIIRRLSEMELPTEDDLSEALRGEEERHLAQCSSIRESYELARKQKGGKSDD